MPLLSVSISQPCLLLDTRARTTCRFAGLKPAFRKLMSQRWCTLLCYKIWRCKKMTPEIDLYCIFHLLFGHLLGHCLLPSTTPEVYLLAYLSYCPTAVATIFYSGSVTRPVMSVGITGGHPFYLVARTKAKAFKKKKFLALVACPYFSLQHMKAFFSAANGRNFRRHLQDV